MEHDPPQEHPTNTVHPVNDKETLLVHVTSFNELMWDNGVTPTRVIEHGVLIPNDVRYTGEQEQGIVIVNHLTQRGRRLGIDVYERVREEVPLALIGMASEKAGGLGEVRNVELPQFISNYRFFFNPIRYTSLGLAVIEAMMVGLPIIGLATTELATVIKNGVSGFIDTKTDNFIHAMKQLLRDRAQAGAYGNDCKRGSSRTFQYSSFY